MYKWLTDPKLNGWNSTSPSWNFGKYLIDEKGKLLNYFPSSVSPTSEKIISQL
jgi:glutathione peroxidase